MFGNDETDRRYRNQRRTTKWELSMNIQLDMIIVQLQRVTVIDDDLLLFVLYD